MRQHVNRRIEVGVQDNKIAKLQECRIAMLSDLAIEGLLRKLFHKQEFFCFGESACI